MGTPIVGDDGPIRTITLDRPEVLNALTVEDLAVISHAVRELPDSVRVVVFRGNGRAFSAGMHLQNFLDTEPDDGGQLIACVGECVGAVRLTPVPTVAMVQGHCLGAAFELALACDFRVAADETARVGLPEVRVGIPSVVDAALLVHHVGLSLAKELILTGAAYRPEQLPGLFTTLSLDEIVPAMLTLTPEVIAAQKSLFETWLNAALQEGIDVSREVFASVFALPVTRSAIERYRR